MQWLMCGAHMYGRGDVDYANERTKEAHQLQLNNMDSALHAGPFLATGGTDGH